MKKLLICIIFVVAPFSLYGQAQKVYGDAGVKIGGSLVHSIWDKAAQIGTEGNPVKIMDVVKVRIDSATVYYVLKAKNISVDDSVVANSLKTLNFDIPSSFDVDSNLVVLFPGISENIKNDMFTRNILFPVNGVFTIGSEQRPVDKIYAHDLDLSSGSIGGATTVNVNYTPAQFLGPFTATTDDSLDFHLGVVNSTGITYLETNSTKSTTALQTDYVIVDYVLPPNFSDFESDALKFSLVTETTSNSNAAINISIFRNDVVTSQHSTGWITSSTAATWRDITITKANIGTNFVSGDRFVIQIGFRSQNDGSGGAYYARMSGFQLSHSTSAD